MAVVTGLTAARMLAIEAASVVDGRIDGDDLILIKFDDSEIDAGSVRGPQGVMGMGPGMIPGELRMFPGSVLPDPDIYSLWVWADGASYVIADHPLASAHLGTTWNTFGGHSSPGAGNFRVPDMRGLTPVGMDSMPGGASANRVVRSAADTLAGLTGEETHVLTEAELATHDHSFNYQNIDLPAGTGDPYVFFPRDAPTTRDDLINDAGSDDPHENMQPTVFIPYIVCLDG